MISEQEHRRRQACCAILGNAVMLTIMVAFTCLVFYVAVTGLSHRPRYCQAERYQFLSATNSTVGNTTVYDTLSFYVDDQSDILCTAPCDLGCDPAQTHQRGDWMSLYKCNDGGCRFTDTGGYSSGSDAGWFWFAYLFIIFMGIVCVMLGISYARTMYHNCIKYDFCKNNPDSYNGLL